MPAVLEYVRDLVTLTGPSGVEGDVVRAVVDRVRPLVDRVDVDSMGNVIAVREVQNGDARTCMLAAHMDEIGFRVRRIEPDGFLRFEKVGGSDNRVLLAQRVWIRTEHGRLLGVIGTKSAHLLSESDRSSVPAHPDLYIDIGARSDAEVREMGVRIGDGVGFVGELAELGHKSGRFAAHALDDRVGCAIALATLDRLRGKSLPVRLVTVFTVQEEVGLRGAQAAARGMPADVGIALETTAVDDTPELRTGNLRLGEGVAIKVMDVSLQVHPAVRRALEQAAEAGGVRTQPEVLMSIGTDAGALQFGGGGVPAGVVSVGTRYTHTPVEVMDVADLEGAVDLLERFILDLGETDLRFTQIEAEGGGPIPPTAEKR